MPEFLPFEGTRYNSAKVSLPLVVAPPYDVISSELRDILYERDPHNVVRLELNRDADPYVSARRFLESWKDERILQREDAPCFYVYYQTFRAPGGETVTRQGVIGRLKLEPYGEGSVLPHERTLAAPKRDRLRLLEATNTNLSPIFGLIADPTFVFDQTLEIASVRAPVADVLDVALDGEKIRHTVWRLEDDLAIDRLTKIVQRDKVIIADGHHRYETGLRYAEEQASEPGARYIMIFLSNLHSEGAVILPTHRLVHGIPGFDPYRTLEALRGRFTLVPFGTREEAYAELERDSKSFVVLEFPEEPRYVLVRDEAPQPRDPSLATLPAMRLQEEILKPILGLSQKAIDDKTHILYPHTFLELDEMAEGLATSDATNIACLLRPVQSEELAAIVERGEFMPQKSTFFYPKLLTGLVFHEFAGQPVSQTGSESI